MQYSVAVRTLCAFTAKRGDLDLRFTPAPSAQEGIAGHQLVAGRRSADYETEITLRGAFGALAVRGRADGYEPAQHRLEEIKTHRGDLARQPANHRHLHWAQLKIYGALFCQARGCDEVNLALVYFDIATQQETSFVETHSALSLQAFFEARCGEFLGWATQELAHRTARDEALEALSFPHEGFRTGQRELAASVYRGAATGRCVLAQAPTGIGKTIATVFSMFKAAPAHGLDKVFYLTAKSTGRRLALDAAALLQQHAAPLGRLRVLELIARDKACEHPGKACHGDACPLARGFYDRLPSARSDALANGFLDAPAVREVALRHEVCPYYLTQELARWSDMVVGDYNYWFDASAMLHAMTVGNEWRVGVLADEAHNLVERARAMYSASLQQSSLRALRATAPVPVRKALEKVSRGWAALREAHEEAEGKLETLPDGFVTALRQACHAIDEHFSQAVAGAAEAMLLQAYFDMLWFVRLADSFGSHSVLEVTHEGAGARVATTVRIQNLIPAPFLKPRFAAARTVTLFSATLNPPAYQRDMLGLPEDAAWVDVASPFSREQLDVQVVSTISTRFAHRQRSASPIAKLIARQFAAQPGNYLAFFSSFDYLDMVAGEFRISHAEVPMWAQSRGMDEGERNAFVARFMPQGAGVGFAVLGGSFGEAIDLRGDRLVGAFVATLGLPQVNARNEQLKGRLDTAFGAGHDYAYLFPGIQKVVQAAGRVIRTQEDRGVLYLIDDRFARPAVRKLLPAWWGLTGTLEEV